MAKIPSGYSDTTVDPSVPPGKAAGVVFALVSQPERLVFV